MIQVSWLDLGVSDVDAAEVFYGSVFGWTFAPPDDAGYRLASLDGSLVAALGPATDPGVPYWTVYLHTKDIVASTDAVVAEGGQVVVPPTPTGSLGVSAVARDPLGSPVSFWEPGTFTGTYPYAVDYLTDNPVAAQAFYSAVVDAAPVCAPVTSWPCPSWLVWFPVTDVPETLNRVTELGGEVVDPSGVLRDPSGAVFAVR